MLITLMLIGQVAYMSQAPLFLKSQKLYEYGYLALDLLFILLIVLGSMGKVAISDSTLIIIGILLYLPIFIKILKQTNNRRSSSNR
ncbi:hypothetical protein [Paenibacillus wenxiniae]|uniref:Uncharacterized protein n=1 Tax=Paenibacillus wenxiniae TaxID=1636843 RepID=A0ABW4RM40_9BACL